MTHGSAPVFLLLGLCSCAAPAAGALVDDARAFEGAVVQVPMPAHADEAGLQPLDRNKIAAGAYLAQVSFSSHHGCSQSWSSSSLTGTMKLEIDGERVVLELDLDRSSVSGSRHHPGDAYRDEHKLAGIWEGKTARREPNHPRAAFRATLAQRSCGEGCAAPIEIVCERERIQLTGRGDLGLPAAERKRPSGGVQGIVCKGLRSVLPSTEVESFPMARGAGVALSSEGNGELRVSFPLPTASR